MCHHGQSPPVLPEIVLQPADHLAVQVVGGLVQDEDVALVDQGGGHGHPLPLAAGQRTHPLVKVRDTQPGEDGLGLILRQLPGLGREPGEHLLQHGAAPLKGRVLGQVLHPDVGVQRDSPLVRLLSPRQNLQQG